MKSKYTNYNGTLTLYEISTGIFACLINARSLYRDAIIFILLCRYNRASTCLLFACEELGKANLLTCMSQILPEASELWKKAWKSFRSHQLKGTHAAIQTVPYEMRKSFDDFQWIVPHASELASLAEKDRQASIYIDFSPKTREWVYPSNINLSTVLRQLRYTRHILKNMGNNRKAGYYSVKSLSIIHEEMADTYSSLLLKPKVTHKDFKALESRNNQCVQRLKEELGISSA